MHMNLKQDAVRLIQSSLMAALPDTAVKAALAEAKFGSGKLVLVSAGKAGWQMANAAVAALDEMGKKIDRGVVVTKYDHSQGQIPGVTIYEAGHPVPDENSYRATQAAIDAVEGLSADDTVLFLLSGGGSALFEKPLIPAEDLQKLTQELLACGADIVEMNTVRKRFSAVKGGRFAETCAPAKVFVIVLSDVLGDRLDMIASGPAYPDASTAAQARAIVEKYHLTMTAQMKALLQLETPKDLANVETHITGSVRQLCETAAITAKELGYVPLVLTDQLNCVAREAGTFLGNIAKYYADTDRPMAVICGGETVVHLTGHGKGGRNQELALAAAEQIQGLNALVFSVGSDGTDGPTDAAGGMVDGTTCQALKELGISIPAVLQENDAYNALKQVNGLIMTGPTGTNVNDLAVLLIGGEA
ncbi:MAG: glycerate kinase [Firmicutes bacterium]|nr:glycerate kinase [Bacillota bacterium]